MINIVLLEPEIPFNTGAIGRTCVATGCRLHLIEPMGFSIDEKQVKRAGLDYWPRLDVTKYDCYEDFLAKNPNIKMYYATTKGKNIYADVEFPDGAYVMFGKESAGIPESILAHHKDECIRIPMMGQERSLNLSNSVAVIAYEALRQQGFAGMNTEGHLTKFADYIE
ncbi:MAG: tRNA (cytidine(34)-2'-O)-methyltransferase [Lachnospiraceae bacterium]|nr:tRNA (cytidine(34)-2'-O)-methyltransferase [Lachnospiraceae bacterium]MBO4462180.1 tRNA (cytidine(34)-2'-O)-methyltransferase [Lachnospiraceae bacterium]MBR4794981.1 tRNA (cytidine(34)-2'-O)-methyltransferase [Lachnospiraceae bacterium]MBR5789103.1 tRNA (cytidine(34)-2'-O)-methyltransferase [Lachnospiraceae bacterium]